MLQAPSIIICLTFAVIGMIYGAISTALVSAERVNYWHDLYLREKRENRRERGD